MYLSTSAGPVADDTALKTRKQHLKAEDFQANGIAQGVDQQLAGARALFTSSRGKLV